MSEWKLLSHVWVFATPWTVALQALLCPWCSPGKNTGVGCHSCLQGIFPNQGSSPALLFYLLWVLLNICWVSTICQALFHASFFTDVANHFFRYRTLNEYLSVPQMKKKKNAAHQCQQQSFGSRMFLHASVTIFPLASSQLKCHFLWEALWLSLALYVSFVAYMRQSDFYPSEQKTKFLNPICYYWLINVILTWLLWPPDVKSQLIGKDPDAGKDWRQEEKGMTEDEMDGIANSMDMSLSMLWELVMNRDLVCAGPWSHKELDMTEWLNWDQI